MPLSAYASNAFYLLKPLSKKSTLDLLFYFIAIFFGWFTFPQNKLHQLNPEHSDRVLKSL
jgi:hypothetical protein